MYLTGKAKSIRSGFFAAAVVGLTTAGLWFGAQFNTTEANTNNTAVVSAPAATFAADAASLGLIPDGAGATTCGSDGAPRSITFNVTGITGTVTNVEVNNLTFNPAHSWVGDVTAVLVAPNGASHTLFGYTGSTVAAGCGDDSNVLGPYGFKDSASAPPSGGWWQAATAASATTALTSGDYRTTARGGAGAVNPQPPTNMNAAFAGVTNANGTWTLRVTDGGVGDTGGVSAASLTIDAGPTTPTATPQHVVDFDGNNRTDFAVVRNVGGGAGGQVRWFVGFNGATGGAAPDWGLSTDFFVPEDYDGDNRTDYAVWRAGNPTVAAFYILQSATNTVRIERFGQSGDNPTIVGDYDGDNRADVAVYRAGANAGDPSTWYYRGTLNNTGGNVTFVPWGQNGDFPAPGDYDGDNRNDFVIQRNNGAGNGVFWMRQSTAGFRTVTFGAPTDVIVPGDYDGDGKTDIATARGSGGSIFWFVLRSSGGAYTTQQWGNSATDFISQGDYDGDGRTDLAVWRPSATAGQSAFYYLGSTSGANIVPYGQQGDYPVANFNTH